MKYDILSNDIFKDKKKNKKNKTKIKPIFIHLIILGVIFIGIMTFFLSSFSLDVFKQEGTITLIGDINEFNHSYFGNLTLFSSKFNLEFENGKFSDERKEFEIINFSGQIYYINKSFVIDGTADKISYGKNSFNLNGKELKLIALKKTNLNLNFEELNLDFKSGRVKIDNSLNYGFSDSIVKVKNFNSSIIYDGTFSFIGRPEEFYINSPKQNLEIIYSSND